MAREDASSVSPVLQFRGETLSLGNGPVMMGILNVTPDSFSDGGQFLDEDAAMRQAGLMLEEGARVLDVGGESTRPGAGPVDVLEEVERVVPIVKAIKKRFPEAIVSVDTTKSAVAREALLSGADWINDVSGLADEQMAVVIAESQAGCVLMFNARRMPLGESIVDSVRSGWRASLEKAFAAGVGRDQIVLDPGVGFGTSREQDLEILRSLRELSAESYPLLLGTSKKRVTGEPLALGLEERYETTLATTVAGVEQGVALFRVHDVAGNLKAARMARLIYG